MFFSIVKIAILCLVIISFLYMLYRTSGKRKKASAQEKLEEAKDLYYDAKEEISDAERLIREQESEAQRELREAATLKEKAENTKQIIH